MMSFHRMLSACSGLFHSRPREYRFNRCALRMRCDKPLHTAVAEHILLASNGPWPRKKCFYRSIFCLCLNYQFYLFNFASGLCWYYHPRSDCVIILTVFCVHSAAALFLHVVAEGGGGGYVSAPLPALWFMCLRACVCVFARAGCGSVRKRCAIRHCSLSLEDRLCHNAPCFTEYQPYTKLASRGDVGQAGNDAADKHRGKLVDDGRRPSH